jgi:SARP family transcriptional regulator, regulator of embCAB operon
MLSWHWCRFIKRNPQSLCGNGDAPGRPCWPRNSPPGAGSWLTSRHRGSATSGIFERVYERALSCYVHACLGIGGTELPAAERAARALIATAPTSEAGYRLLMQAQAANGDTPSALRTYEQLRRILADELGVDPDRKHANSTSNY